MKVLHINFSDTGGAAIAARRSHLALLNAGIDSKMLVAKRSAKFPELYSLKHGLLRKLWRFFQLKHEAWLKRRVPQGDRCLRNANHLPGFILSEIMSFSPDVVHLHWVNAGMLSINEIQKIGVPVVWTFHDLWPLTGAYHYTGSMMTPDFADQYPSQFEEFDGSGYSKDTGTRYRNSIVSKPDGIITLCRNFEKAVRVADWFSHSVVTRIPNCIDLKLFAPSDQKMELRREISLPDNKTLLLYLAAGFDSWNKGIDLLLQAMEELDEATRCQCELVMVGRASRHESSVINGMKCHRLGSIQEEAAIAKIYKICDVFLCPSREDNFPNTVVEASASGLPVVAFKTGGLSDMIEHEQTGYLAKAFCVQDYAKGIEMTCRHKKEWGRESRGKAIKAYDRREHARSLSQMYHRVLNTKDQSSLCV